METKPNTKMFTTTAILFIKMYNNPDYNLSTLAFKTNITYSHVNKIMKELQKQQLLNMKIIGRANKIVFTTKGTILAELLKHISKLKHLDEVVNLD